VRLLVYWLPVHMVPDVSLVLNRRGLTGSPALAQRLRLWLGLAKNGEDVGLATDLGRLPGFLGGRGALL
jgi:hypothetical protein